MKYQKTLSPASKTKVFNTNWSIPTSTEGTWQNAPSKLSSPTSFPSSMDATKISPPTSGAASSHKLYYPSTSSENPESTRVSLPTTKSLVYLTSTALPLHLWAPKSLHMNPKSAGKQHGPAEALMDGMLARHYTTIAITISSSQQHEPPSQLKLSYSNQPECQCLQHPATTKLQLQLKT